MNRPNVSEYVVSNKMRQLFEQITRRTSQHGNGAFVSRHEILGLITEEYAELAEAVRSDGDSQRFSEELMDIAVVCVFGLASMEETNKNA